VVSSLQEDKRLVKVSYLKKPHAIIMINIEFAFSAFLDSDWLTLYNYAHNFSFEIFQEEARVNLNRSDDQNISFFRMFIFLSIDSCWRAFFCC